MTDEKKAPLQIPLQSSMQVLTLAVLGMGGWVGNGAYEDLRAEMVRTRVEAAEMRKVVEAMDQRMGTSQTDLSAMRSKVDALVERVTRLEVGR